MSNKALQIDHTPVFAAEPKKNARVFCEHNGQCCHHYERMETYGGHCLLHDRDCIAEACDVVVIGFPCAPFSRMRSSTTHAKRKRSSKEHAKSHPVLFQKLCEFPSNWSAFLRCFESFGRWQSHPEAPIMMTALKWIKQHKPSSLLLENVMGLQDAPNDEVSPLQYIMETLSGYGYTTRVFDMDTTVFVQSPRPRHVAQDLDHHLARNT
eukprot:5374485-Amphidinium_carterae.1